MRAVIGDVCMSGSLHVVPCGLRFDVRHVVLPHMTSYDVFCKMVNFGLINTKFGVFGPTDATQQIMK